MRLKSKFIAGLLILTLVILACGFGIGDIVSKNLEDSVVHNTKTQTATYINT